MMMMEEEEKEGGNNATDHQAREGRVSRASEADMFEVSDEEKEEEVADSGIIQSSLAVESQQPPLSSIEVADESQLPATGLSSSECSGLPASFYQVKQGALEDLKTYVPPVKPVAPPQSLGRLVDEGKDVGPFYGLPSKVVTLYQQHKRVTELFDWQKACLSTQAVKQKTNLLYSLPTSSGKTMVAEIVMLQELLCYKKNVIFVLPYVSIVQEKVRALAPFALELGFHLQEYAGARGIFPPKKRLHKRDLFVCTIEKAHSLFNSLVLEGRREEVGLLVVDEVHMVGEKGGRGANLEALLTKVKHVNQGLPYKEKMQVVAMSATVGNLKELSTFLEAELFTENFRPVKLVEHVVVGNDICEVRGTGASVVEERFVFTRKTQVATKEAKVLDEEGVAGLVLEAFPSHSVLVFCDSKKRCENVAGLLVNVIQLDLEVVDKVREVKQKERSALLAAISSLTFGFICPTLQRTIPFGIAYHHSGLTADERKVIEEGFLEGSLGVLACTSTLAAGVNLPARRVILRSPFMGRNLLTHGQYKQMVGRAGRAGLDTFGESFLMLKETGCVKTIANDVVASPVEHCISSLP